MKVLIFTTQFYLLGGAERLAVELAEELNKQGIHADILSMYSEDLTGVTDKKRELLKRGIPTVHFLGLKINPPMTSLIAAILKLRRLIRENAYDVVETSLISPTVIASWENDNSKQHFFWRFTVRFNSRTCFYAISDFVADYWIRYSSTSPGRTRRIYNCIPDNCFEASPEREGVRRELGISTDSRIVLFVGRLAAYKGIDTLLYAIGPVLEQYNLVLVYVGHEDILVKDTTKMLENMNQKIAEESWGHRVHFLGRREDVTRLMASSDVLAHPTRMEGFGLVLAEAMATGLPVVASNVEGIPEVLAGTDSIMISPDDPVALLNAVLTVLNWTPDERSRAIAKGKQRAEGFRTGKRTEAMIRLFEDLIADHF
jgi:glycosyltransferase involved in cell wall biosynthesis